MQEKFSVSPENESIDEILESIKGLVYPPVIDLNRPLRDDIYEKEIKSSVNLSKDTGGTENPAVQALSSFMHSVREKKDELPVQEPKQASIKEGSLEDFLTGVVQNALAPHIRSILEGDMQTFLHTEGKQFMESIVSQWFELQGKDIVRIWLEKHAPALVVRCVELYLQKLSQAAH